jgi:hypothetical protein
MEIGEGVLTSFEEFYSSEYPSIFRATYGHGRFGSCKGCHARSVQACLCEMAPALTPRVGRGLGNDNRT